MKIYFLCRGAAYIHERDIFRKNILILSFMEIRRARRDELPRLMEIYDAARRFMRSRGNNVQWVGGYPSVELVGAGIDAGEQWVTVQDGTVVATFWFAVAPEPTYVKIYDGEWLDCEPYGVVHRLASDGSVKGVGEECLRWSLEQCGNLRVDTHSNNDVMQSLLEREGFVRCGVIILTDGTPRDAFQKKGRNAGSDFFIRQK